MLFCGPRSPRTADVSCNRIALAVSLLATLTSGSPSDAGGYRKAPGLRQDNVLAKSIFVCSEIPGLTAATIRTFFKTAFPGWRGPSIGSPDLDTGFKPTVGVLFVATNTHLGKDLQACVDDFEDLGWEIGGLVDETADGIGRPPPITNAMSEYYGPTFTLWRYSWHADRTVIVYATSIDGPNAIDDALTNLFGLDSAFCDQSPACEAARR